MFSEQFNPSHIENLVSQSLLTTPQEAEETINKTNYKLSDLPALLSPAAEKQIETLAQKSQTLTRNRFGNTIQLFIPMYLSNECYNTCTYCGFSMEHTFKRKTLTTEEIRKEAEIISQKGFKHILLLTGESPKKVGTDYIKNAISIINPLFSSIGIEVQPLKQIEYETLINEGVEQLTLYQETYHPDAYKKYHLTGLKKNFKNRLDALENGAKAGFFKINIGALLGLYDWRYEALSLAHHLNYLTRHYWKTKYAISFPRIQDKRGSFNIHYPISDTNMVQLISVFRLLFPDLGITLSTRETPNFRNNILTLGITSMSAESSTNPGGYSGDTSEKQFEIHDTRNINEITNLLQKLNLDPVFKDWDSSLMTTNT